MKKTLLAVILMIILSTSICNAQPSVEDKVAEIKSQVGDKWVSSLKNNVFDCSNTSALLWTLLPEYHPIIMTGEFIPEDYTKACSHVMLIIKDGDKEKYIEATNLTVRDKLYPDFYPMWKFNNLEEAKQLYPTEFDIVSYPWVQQLLKH